MKNRGRPKNVKGLARRPEQVAAPAPQSQRVQPGLVAQSLLTDITALFEEARNHRRLVDAIRKLSSERVTYADLEKDLVAILNPPVATAPVQGG